MRTVLQTVRKLTNEILKVKELRNPSLFKNLFMLSVRVSNYGCTREVWRARKNATLTSTKDDNEFRLTLFKRKRSCHEVFADWIE